MLGDKEAVATLAVKDLGAARKFYEGVLGLKVKDAQGSEAITFKGGGAQLIVYRSQFAGTEQGDRCQFLGRRGDRQESSTASRIAVSCSSTTTCPGWIQGRPARRRGFKTAWFKDPDGNILCLMNM